jgi:hypothetical protein
MIKPTVEYVSFRSGAERREYLLRSHVGPEIHEHTIGIAHAAFVTGRIRFQDGPEICYLKLMRELEAAADNIPPADSFIITDAELVDYVTAHTVPARRRYVPPSPPAGGAPVKAAADHAHPAPPAPPRRD